jgi:hypothetical protein
MPFSNIDKPSKYFNTVTYTGNGTTNTAITGVGFKPDLYWGKKRSAVGNNFLANSISGVGKHLISDATDAETTFAEGIKSFDTDGFTLGTAGDINQNSATFVAWNWLGANTTVSNTAGTITSTVSANTTSGFSIVSYTGTGANATVGHGLGVAPKFIIIKNRSAVTHWMVGCNPIGWTNYLVLSLSQESISDSQVWNNTAPTSIVFSVGVASPSNGSGNNMIAYCFAEVKGYSKFGSFVGNGSTDGTFLYTGFSPAFVMFKNTTTANRHWYMMDNKRNTYNVANIVLTANFANDESWWGTGNNIDFLSNGIKIRSNSDINNSGDNFIYMAFASSPFVSSKSIPTTAR